MMRNRDEDGEKRNRFIKITSAYCILDEIDKLFEEAVPDECYSETFEIFARTVDVKHFVKESMQDLFEKREAHERTERRISDFKENALYGGGGGDENVSWRSS